MMSVITEKQEYSFDIGKDYVFENTDDLVNYLYYLLDNPSQIKIQKTIYLLYAFYGASYGSIQNEKDEEFLGNYPKELFNAKFEAWRYGPVENSVYGKQKNGCYHPVKIIDIDSEEEQNIINFIHNICNQTNGMDDFSLVDRTHQDNCWLDVYQEETQHIKMDNETIIEEYKELYVGK